MHSSVYGDIACHAAVNIVRQTGIQQQVSINWPLAEAYYETAQQLRAKFGLADTLSVQDFLLIPELIKLGESSGEYSPLIQEELLICLEEAVLELKQMRQAEGEFLQADLTSRLKAIQELHQFMRILAPRS